MLSKRQKVFNWFRMNPKGLKKNNKYSKNLFVIFPNLTQDGFEEYANEYKDLKIKGKNKFDKIVELEPIHTSLSGLESDAASADDGELKTSIEEEIVSPVTKNPELEINQIIDTVKEQSLYDTIDDDNKIVDVDKLEEITKNEEKDDHHDSLANSELDNILESNEIELQQEELDELAGNYDELHNNVEVLDGNYDSDPEIVNKFLDDIKNLNNNDNLDDTKNEPVETSNDFLAMLTEEDTDDILPNEDSREFKEKETLEDKNISVEKSNPEAEKDETVAVTEPDKVDDFENEYQQIIDEFSKEDDLSKYDNILSNDNDSESNTDVESFSLENSNQEDLDEINDLDSKLVKDLIDNFDFIANDSADDEDSYAKKSEETNEDTPESEQSDIDDNQNSDLNNTEIEENKQNSSTFENQNKSSDEDDIEDILNLSDSDLTNLISNENVDNDISAETQESVPKEDISDEASKTISGNTLPVAKQTDEEITSKDIKEKQDIYEPLEDDLSDSENIKLKNDNDYQEGQISKNKEIDKKEGALIISEKKSKSMDQNDEDVELEVKKDISDSKDKPIIEDSKTEFIQDKEIESQKLSEQKISEEEALNAENEQNKQASENSKEPTNKELEDKEESVEEKSIESRSMQTIENEIENLISEEDDSSEFLKENLTDNEIVNDLEEKIIEEPKLDKEEDILTTKKIDKTESELSTKMTHYSLLKQVEGLTRSKSDEKKISKESKLTNRASTSDSKKGNKQKRKRRTRIHRVIITEE